MDVYLSANHSGIEELYICSLGLTELPNFKWAKALPTQYTPASNKTVNIWATIVRKIIQKADVVKLWRGQLALHFLLSFAKNPL